MRVNSLMKVQASRRFLILGMGVTGRSVARWMSRQSLQFDMADSRDELTDRDQLLSEFPDAQLFLGEAPAVTAEDYQAVVLSPGISPESPVVQQLLQQNASFTGDIDLFAGVAEAPLTAVTGSNGKSTVVDMLKFCYQQAGVPAAMGGNFGVPALDLLQAGEIKRFILELSSFQLDLAEVMRADVATVLNVSEDHMDRYPSLQDYAQSKGRIYRDVRVAVVNRDDLWSQQLSVEAEQVISFGLDAPAPGHYGLRSNQHETYLCRGEKCLLAVSELKVLGKHNWANALAVLALGEAGGLAEEAMISALRRYQGLPHRMEWVTEHNQVVWINDSKATNVGAVAAALEGLDKQVILLAGGRGKGADFQPLIPAATQYVKHAIVFGEDQALLAQHLGQVTAMTLVENLEQAVASANAIATAGDVVLLSPACSSFDQFENFTVRGDQFRQLVLALNGEAG